MCLYVVREDRCGGGHSLLLDTDVLTRYLSRQTLHILHTSNFLMNIPIEFLKGTSQNLIGKIIFEKGLWRYRSDLIVKEKCSEKEIEALNELDNLLKNPHLILATDLPFDSVLVLDNCRWMHGRTIIKDEKRWLKRIRYYPIQPPPSWDRVISRTISIQCEEEKRNSV